MRAKAVQDDFLSAQSEGLRYGSFHLPLALARLCCSFCREAKGCFDEHLPQVFAGSDSTIEVSGQGMLGRHARSHEVWAAKIRSQQEWSLEMTGSGQQSLGQRSDVQVEGARLENG
jgi:hypothetical protein